MKKRFKKVLTVVLAMVMLIGLFTVNVPISAASNCSYCDYSTCKCTDHSQCRTDLYWAFDKDRTKCDCANGVMCSGTAIGSVSGRYTANSSSRYIYIQVTNLQEFNFYASFYTSSTVTPSTECVSVYISGILAQMFWDSYDDNVIYKHIKLDAPYTGTIMITLHNGYSMSADVISGIY